MKICECCKCGMTPLDKDTVGINRKLLGVKTKRFMCVRCLAEFYGTEEHVLRAKIEELKENNCPFFN